MAIWCWKLRFIVNRSISEFKYTTKNSKMHSKSFHVYIISLTMLWLITLSIFFTIWTLNLSHCIHFVDKISLRTIFQFIHFQIIVLTSCFYIYFSSFICFVCYLNYLQHNSCIILNLFLSIYFQLFLFLLFNHGIIKKLF